MGESEQLIADFQRRVHDALTRRVGESVRHTRAEVLGSSQLEVVDEAVPRLVERFADAARPG